MADYAIRVEPDGTETRVYAKDLGEENRKECYRCAGHSERGPKKGEACCATVYLAIGSDCKNYFRAKKASDHVDFCEFKEKPVKKSIIKHLDQIASDQTDRDILDRIVGKNQGGQTSSGSHSSKPLIGAEAKAKEPDEDPDLEIIRQRMYPLNAGDVYRILSQNALDALFAQKPVSEWIVDARTFSQYAEQGLKDSQIAVVVLHKCSLGDLPPSLSNLTSNYCIFVCSFPGTPDKQLYFLISKSAKGLLDELFKSNQRYYAVLAEWKRKSIPNAYFCDEALSRKNICTDLDS